MGLIPHPLVANSQLTIEPLDQTHDRAAFVCLDSKLTEYITGQRAFTEVENKDASVYVCVDAAKQVLGFFTLSSGGISRDSICRALYGNNWAEKSRDFHRVARKFPYKQIGVTVLGRIAIHSSLKGCGFGTIFIAFALRTALEKTAGAASKAIILDAKNEKVSAIYKGLGFISFPDTPLSMFIPMETIQKMF